MKKGILPAIVTATVALAALSPQYTKAADGTITFNGQITDTTCTITGGGAATGTSDITVTLPPVSVSALPADGSTAGDTSFSLVLGGGTNCTNGKTAALWVETSETPALDTATGALTNQASGGATNVQVRLVNPTNNQPIDLSINAIGTGSVTNIPSSNQPAAVIANNTATLNFIGQYLAKGGAATAGTVTTYLTYSMQYN